MNWASRSIALAIACAVVLAACMGGEEGAQNPPERVATERTAPEPPPEPESLLEDGYHEDPDGDAIPTAIELQIGTDPEVDDCLTELDCPGIDGATGGLGDERGENLMLILDSSGSMAAQAGGQTKIAAARDALGRYVTGTPDNVDIGFTVYGHRGSNEPAGKAESCAGVETLGGLGAVDYRSFPRTLQSFAPTGYTPIAASLERAAGAFRGREGDSNRVVLVTDGIETCGGDPVDAARSLKRAGVAVTVDVVGFDIPGESDAAALREIAEVTGGEYTDAGTAAELRGFVDAQLETARQTTEARLCAARQATELRLCQARRITDARLFLARTTTDLRLDEQSERADALDEVSQRMNDDYADLSERREDEIAELTDRIEREAREAEQRLRRRYGPQAGVDPSAFACVPAGGAGRARPT